MLSDSLSNNRVASKPCKCWQQHLLILQIMFAVFGSIASIPIAFTAHIGGFFAGVFLTKLFVEIERKKRAKYSRPSGNNTYDT